MVTGAIIKLLERFHNQVAQLITGMTDCYKEDGEWEYPLVADAVEAAGICPIKEYIHIWKATIAAQVACKKIYDVCTGAERTPEYSQIMKWWYQDMVREE